MHGREQWLIWTEHALIRLLATDDFLSQPSTTKVLLLTSPFLSTTHCPHHYGHQCSTSCATEREIFHHGMDQVLGEQVVISWHRLGNALPGSKSVSQCTLLPSSCCKTAPGNPLLGKYLANQGLTLTLGCGKFYIWWAFCSCRKWVSKNVLGFIFHPN